MPVHESVSNPLDDLSQSRATPDEGQVGYYKSSLASGITVELAATEHAGLYQYTFEDSTASSIVVDVSHVLPSFRGLGWEQHYSKGNFSFSADGHYEGSGTYNNGWNLCMILPSSGPLDTNEAQRQTGPYTFVDDSTRTSLARSRSKALEPR